MKLKLLCLSIVLILILICGCHMHQPDNQNQLSADTITEGILQGINKDNYEKFSDHFDQEMKDNIPEEEFKTTNTEIKAKIGSYISKNYVSTERKGQYTVVIYKAKFSKEPGAVIVKTVLSKENGNLDVADFSLDSPKLRE